jgi:hypothetical protein
MPKDMNVPKEFKSHSSWLYNDRLAVLFYLLDMESVRLNETSLTSDELPRIIRRVNSLNKQIYKNIRMVIRSDAVMRGYLKLSTKDAGVYTTDIQLNLIQKALQFCDEDPKGFTPKRCAALVTELNDLEIVLKDILQYYSYFIRVGMKQKPDMLMATEKYKMMSDKMTLEQLKSVAGKNNKINFDTPQLEDAEDEDDFEEMDDDEDDE